MTVSPLEELKAKEAAISADLLNPRATEIELPKQFYPEQVGLREVMCDGIGRLWDVTARPMKMIFDPKNSYRRPT